MPPWVSLFLVIVIGWQLAKIIWLLVPAPVTGDAIQTPINIPVGSSQATGSADVQIIANNHMFGEASTDSVAIAPAPVADDNLSDTRLTNLVLKGTIASDIPEFSVAVIADGTEEQNVYAIGDSIGSGTTLHAVYAERVVLNENVALTNLRLPSEFPAGQSRPVRRATNVSRQATRSSNTQNLQNVVTENLTKLSDVIRPTPYLVNGQQACYRVYPGRNRQQFSALGLRHGDLINDIDGQSLSDPTQAMQVFQSLGTAEQVTVTVERNGQPQTIILKTSQLDLSGEQTK